MTPEEINACQPVKMLVDQEWLTRHVETDPDLDCEVGHDAEGREAAEPGLDYKPSKATLDEIETLKRRNVVSGAHLQSFVMGATAAPNPSDVEDEAWLASKRASVHASFREHNARIDRILARLRAQPNTTKPAMGREPEGEGE